MSKFVPKAIPDADWVQLSPERDYAVRADKGDTICFRLGGGQGIFLAIAPAPVGRFVYSVEYETGEPALLAKMPEGQPIIIGRISECLIKIMHALVSRRHVEIRLEGPVVVIKDLGSTNGTFLAPDTPHFDIAKYLESNPIEGAEDRTLDQIHEIFGPTLDDFLRSYSQK